MAREAVSPLYAENMKLSPKELWSWYSNREVLVLLASIFVLTLSIASITPPLQSPDEPDHLARAYLLARGEVFLGARNGVTGGEIDTGLLEYAGIFQDLEFHYERKVTATDLRAAVGITWSGKRQFTGLPNTAVYFPLCYLPQALALAIGERVGLTVNTTYYMARIATLLGALGILYFALISYPAPPLVLILVTTPMSLFQLSSTSLDPIAFAMSALAAALFMRAIDRRVDVNRRMHWVLCLCTLCLSTCRANMLPVTLLPLIQKKLRPSVGSWTLAGIVPLLSVLWTGVALTAVRGLFTNELSTTEALRYYLLHPVTVCRILIDTFLNSAVLRVYWDSFVGVLGWVDTPLDPRAYVTFGVVLLLLTLWGFWSHRGGASSLYGRVALALVALSSLVLIFLVELLWTPYSAPIILGVVGRYFTCPLIVATYAAFGTDQSRLQARYSVAIVLLWIALAAGSMTPTLVYRYWLT